jgi:hypothetical protein
VLNQWGSRIIEVSLVLIVLYLVLQNGRAFSDVTQAIGSVYTSGVKTLQGR